jgi:acylphosphatase
VRNTHDGNVEVWAEGNREKLEALLKWLRHGPPGARVDSVLEEPRLPTGKYKTFSVEY